MNFKMKTARKKMLARDLKGLIDLPNYDDNERVEVTVTPVAAEPERKILSDEEIEAIMDRLTGCLAGLDKTKTLDDWRMERLAEKHGLKLVD